MPLATNKNLEDLFDIAAPDKDDSANTETTVAEPSPQEITPHTLAELDKIEAALPQVRGLEASDAEMDDLANRARESFDDLMNLGMQVDSRYASEIFAVAGTMLGHAITAKTAKLNKKLRMIDLQLKKARLDSDRDDKPQVATGQGRILDRNDLLRTLARRDDETPKPDK